MVQSLLEHPDIDVNAKRGEATPLLAAVIRGDKETVR